MGIAFIKMLKMAVKGNRMYNTINFIKLALCIVSSVVTHFLLCKSLRFNKPGINTITLFIFNLILLFTVNYLGKYYNVSIPINFFNASISMACGIGGICMLIICDLVF